MRVVVSLTTIPGRSAFLERTMASLRSQTYQPDAIYLWLPEEHFGSLPPAYRFAGVKVSVGPDLGPAMKILPLLAIETDPETLIIPVDDDVEYPPELIERLVRATALHPDQAIGFTGWSLAEDVAVTAVRHLNEDVAEAAMFQPVHVLEGYRGIVYQRGFFDMDIFEDLAALPAFRFHDDILLSGYLASRGIGRIARWFGSSPVSASGHWKLHGQDMGLHTTHGWLEHGKACVNYWRQRAPDAFPDITTKPKSERLQLDAVECPHPGFLQHVAPGIGIQADVLHDLRARPWPWRDGQFQEVLALGRTELADSNAPVDAAEFEKWLDECIRILRPGGHLKARLPQSLVDLESGGSKKLEELLGNASNGLGLRAILEPEFDHVVLTVARAG